jgi:O-antigen ligase
VENITRNIVTKGKIIKFINSFQMIAFIILPIFLLRSGTSLRNVTHPLMVLTFVKIILEKKVINWKELKKIYIPMMIFVLLIFINIKMIEPDSPRYADERIRTISMTFMMFFMMTQIKIKDIYYKYQSIVMDIGFSVYIINFMMIWKKMGYPLTERFSGADYIFIFSNICLLGTLYYFIKIIKSIKNKEINAIKNTVLFLLLFWGDIISNSRMSLLTLLFVMFLILMNEIIQLDRMKTKMMILIIFLMFLGGALQVKTLRNRLESVLTTKLDGSNSQRLELWKTSIYGITNHPLKGNGFISFMKVSKEEHEDKIKNREKITEIQKETYKFNFNQPHQNYLSIWMGLGIFGLFLYVVILVNILKELVLKYVENKNMEYIIGISFIVSLLLLGLTDTMIRFRRVNEIIFYIAGILLMLNEKKLSEGKKNYKSKVEIK